MAKKNPTLSQAAINELIAIRLRNLENALALANPAFLQTIVAEDDIADSDTTPQEKNDMIAFMKSKR